MTNALIALLILAAIMLVVLWILAKFLPAVVMQILYVICGIVLLLKALAFLGISI